MSRTKPVRKTILNDMSEVTAYYSTHEEGKDYINIGSSSNNLLGRALSKTHKISVKTFLGTVRTIDRFMNYLTNDNYPIDFLSKPIITKTDIESLGKAKLRTVPNYWALIAYILCERVYGDKEIISLLKENTLPFTWMTKSKTTFLFDKEILMQTPNFKMGKYLSIIRHIEKMIKEDKFTREDIKEFINECKECPDVDILEGVRLPEGSEIKDK